MIIGIPKEIKEHEYRVSVTPSGVKELVNDGHRVIAERSAGIGSGFPDEDYLLTFHKWGLLVSESLWLNNCKLFNG